MATENQFLQGSIVPWQKAPKPVEPGVTIGHVHLRTADIDRVRAFYVDLMGFDVVMEARDVPGWGTTGDILFVAAGGYHHPPRVTTGKEAGGGAGAPTPSGSTRGSGRAAGRSPTAWRACTTWRSAIRRARAWPTRCGACSRSTGRCASARTMGRTRRSTSPTRTATTSSCAGTGRSTNGRGTPTARST